jgi:ribosomal protein S18 acetylase RimI-like enzyme
LDSVAREQIYIEMVSAPPLEDIVKFQTELIAENLPVAYALAGNRVVGWCDISRSKNPRLCHRGGLGMGVHADYHGQGIGTKLLEHCLVQATALGLEKIELQVYTENKAAIALYKKLGFKEEGLLKKYRKLGDRYFDVLSMAKFI